MAAYAYRMDEGNEIPQMIERNERTTFDFCPYCGSSAFITNNAGRSYECRDCNFQFYVNNSAAVACLFFNSTGELLLTRRAVNPSIGMLDLPGGFVEPFESAEEAVDREIKEELNIEIKQKKYLTSFPNLYPYSGFIVPTVDLVFVCEAKQWNSLVPGDDVASIEFILPSKIVFDDLCSPSIKQIIRYCIGNYSK